MKKNISNKSQNLWIFYRKSSNYWPGFPDGSDGKESACSAGDPDSIPGSGRFPGEGNGNPLQYSCLENPMDRGAWRAVVLGITKSDLIEWLTHTGWNLVDSTSIRLSSPGTHGLHLASFTQVTWLAPGVRSLKPPLNLSQWPLSAANTLPRGLGAQWECHSP